MYVPITNLPFKCHTHTKLACKRNPLSIVLAMFSDQFSQCYHRHKLRHTIAHKHTMLSCRCGSKTDGLSGERGVEYERLFLPREESRVGQPVVTLQRLEMITDHWTLTLTIRESTCCCPNTPMLRP